MNQDEQHDFGFGVGHFYYFSREYNAKYVQRRAGNNIAFSTTSLRYPKPLIKGDSINSQLAWKSRRYSTSDYGNYHRFILSQKIYSYSGNRTSYKGLWGNLSHKYIGLRVGKGQFYYGWARLSVSLDSLIVEAYGLNPVADSGITAGKNDTITSPQIAIDSLAQFCKGDSLELILNNPVSNEHLQWYQNGSPLPGDTNQFLIVKSEGYYFVIKNFDGNTFSLSNSVSISHPFLSVFIYHNYSNTLLHAYAYGTGPFQYQWFKNGQIVSDTTADLVVTQSGTYWVVVTDSFGCSVTSAPDSVFLTGIRSFSKDPVKLYTANRKLYVQLTDASLINGTINIFNTLGQSVLQQIVSSENITLNLESFEPGIYFVRLEKNGKQVVKKISIL